MIVTGQYIRKLRKDRGLSQHDLASLSNISQAHIAKIENEKVDPRLSTVNRMLVVLRKEKERILCGQIMTKKIIFVRPRTPVREIISIMKSSGISQIPVFENGKAVGSIREMSLLRSMEKNLKYVKAGDVMERPFPVVDADDPVDMLPPLFEIHPAVLVSVRGRLRGIITKSDFLSHR